MATYSYKLNLRRVNSTITVVMMLTAVFANPPQNYCASSLVCTEEALPTAVTSSMSSDV